MCILSTIDVLYHMIIMSFECFESVRWYDFCKSPVMLDPVLCEVHLHVCKPYVYIYMNTQTLRKYMYMYIPMASICTTQIQFPQLSMFFNYIHT